VCVSISARSAEPLRDRAHEVDHVTAVAARVGVVGLDHVAEQERRPAVRGSELERVVDADLALARELREEADERHREQDGHRFLDGCERDHEADRCERGVDEVGE
jgi:hypothetical protein